MEQALQIFANGIAGVFVGITVLYIAIRLNSLVCGVLDRRAEKES